MKEIFAGLLKQFFIRFLSALGAIWLLCETVVFFYPALKGNIEKLGNHTYAVSAIYALFGLFNLWHYTAKIKGIDSSIAYKIGSILSQKGLIIIGVNTEFDTIVGNGIVSDQSLHGQVIKKYFSHQIDVLDNNIDLQLSNILPEERPDKIKGKKKSYPVGTCVSVNTHTECKIVFVAISRFNDNCRAQSTIEDIDKALACLWEYLSLEGETLPIYIPVLGTGLSKIQQTRQSIAYRTYDSFMAEISNVKITEKLTIVVSWKDAISKLNINELAEYIDYKTKFRASLVRQNPGGQDIS